MGSIPGPERSSGVGNGNPLQYSCLENSMDKGDWPAIVHEVTKSQTGLSMHAEEKKKNEQLAGKHSLTLSKTELEHGFQG